MGVYKMICPTNTARWNSITVTFLLCIQLLNTLGFSCVAKLQGSYHYCYILLATISEGGI